MLRQFPLSKDGFDIQLRGVHADGKQAEKQAVEIRTVVNIQYYPNNVFQLSTGFAVATDQRLVTPDKGCYKPQKLPFPGTQEFKTSAAAAVKSEVSDIQSDVKEWELWIPRKHVFFPSNTLMATKELEYAVSHALKAPSDMEKYTKFQKIFTLFGYFYPYWIMTGGKFTYRHTKALTGSQKQVIQEVFAKDLYWEAYGGDPSLLYNNRDIDGWLASTENRQILITPLDINPIYELLKDDVSLEIQRVYRKYHHRYDQLPESNIGSENALICVVNKHTKVGVANGVFFDGKTSGMDVVELAHERDIDKLIRPVTIGGKPRLECMVRSAVLGSNMETHAFLPFNFNDNLDTVDGFNQAAAEHHSRLNAGELQPSTRSVKYFAMYVVYGELDFDPQYTKAANNFKKAVTEALNMKTDQDKYKGLETVFKHFGYYYPSSISLGGRIVYEANPRDKIGSWSVEDGVNAAQKLVYSLKDKPIMDLSVNIHTIGIKAKVPNSNRAHLPIIMPTGGASVFTALHEWIETVKTCQQRVHFKALKPMYDLLEDKQRSEVLGLYNQREPFRKTFPEIPRAVGFYGTQAEERAMELVNDKDPLISIMLRDFEDYPNVDHVKQDRISSKDVEKYAALDIASYHDFPGNDGFVLGSKNVYGEHGTAHTRANNDKEDAYHFVYVTYKELHLYDEFIQPTEKFKNAVKEALQVGRQDYDTYFALQEVFHRFGYYYPSSVRIGGRIALRTPSSQQHQQSVKHSNSNRGEKQCKELVKDPEQGNMDIVPMQKHEIGVKSGRELSRHIVTNAARESIAISDMWTALGLRPIYEFLDREQREKVQLTYENMLLSDGRVRYNYLLEISAYKEIFEREFNSISQTIRVPTEALFEKLTERTFSDRVAAMEFCRAACVDYGISVVEAKMTDEIMCVYCSRSGLTEEDSKFNQNCGSACQWGISLCKTAENQWKFRKLENDEECVHNHFLQSEETDNQSPLPINEPADDRTNQPAMQSVSCINLLPKHAVNDIRDANDSFVKYGDIVRLRVVPSSHRPHNHFFKYICASETVQSTAFDGQPGIYTKLQKQAEDPDLDILWKVVRYPLDASGDTEISILPSEPNKKSCLEPKIEHSASDGYEGIDDDSGYVYNKDIVAFESQVLTSDFQRLYLCFSGSQMDSLLSNEFAVYKDESAAWAIQHRNQYIAYIGDEYPESLDERDRRMYEFHKEWAMKDSAFAQYELGIIHMDGTLGVSVDTAEAIKYLHMAADQGHRGALMKLGSCFWTNKEYRKALEIYEKAALLPTLEVYRELGDLYHTGFAAQTFSIPQDHSIAFMYYSTGGIFGDAGSAMKVGRYYEEGYNKNIGTDLHQALRWYEYVSRQFYISEADSAIGRVNHTLANMATDPVEADQYRQDAFKAFIAAANSDTYAKCMVAMYHLNGWAGQQSDPIFGVELLFSLIESGLDIALLGLCWCYEHGIGVERDRSKAIAYRELAINLKKLQTG
ncbi:hypothetical protein EC973_003490 [Apophysomyces ossiformis]|uniref:Uncharacterized protein n=1 Tax=Apophysomyces ossiformis TaxID=679940 RepID=A0A8H7BH67_9FUNG|nr:hypothetical protein EC973_003490 [Apophysomyces ossiformis]